MKKLLSFIIVYLVVFSLVGCNQQDTTTPSNWLEEQRQKENEILDKANSFNVNEQEEWNGKFEGQDKEGDGIKRQVEIMQEYRENDPRKDEVAAYLDKIADKEELNKITATLGLANLDKFEWTTKDGEVLTAFYETYIDTKTGNKMKRYLYSIDKNGKVVYNYADIGIVLPRDIRSGQELYDITPDGYTFREEVMPGSGGYLYYNYTFEGNMYRIEDSNGNVQRPGVRTITLGGQTYLTAVAGAKIQEGYILLDNSKRDENGNMTEEGIQDALESYLKDKNSVTIVNPKVAEESEKTHVDKTANAERLAKKLAMDKSNSEVYEISQKYSSEIPANGNEYLEYLNEQIGKEGYNQSMEESFHNNVSNMGLQALKSTEYVYIQDANATIYTMHYKDAESYLKDLFDYCYAEINKYHETDDENDEYSMIYFTSQKKNNITGKLTGVFFLFGSREHLSKLRKIQKEYGDTLRKFAQEKYDNFNPLEDIE